jgi:hypothetical protein
MKRGEVTMSEFEDERPIPLGRAAVASRPADEPVARPVVAPADTLPPAAHIEKTREQTPPPDEPAAPSPSTVESAPVVVAEPPAGPRDVAPAAVVVDAPAATEHPLGALSGFRMRVELVEPVCSARDVGRFLVAYVVVAAFVLGLIAAFLALTTRTHA